jgi:hypothetical protein
MVGDPHLFEAWMIKQISEMLLLESGKPVHGGMKERIELQSAFAIDHSGAAIESAIDPFKRIGNSGEFSDTICASNRSQPPERAEQAEKGKTNQNVEPGLRH